MNRIDCFLRHMVAGFNNPIKRFIFSIKCLCLIFAAANALAFEISKAPSEPSIDGVANDLAWQQAQWRPIDQLILGVRVTPEDFSGRYKLVWTEQHLLLLAEITDDVLVDRHANPLFKYWEDDTLELFIDENASGGNHLENHSAFAYHIALDNQAVDIAEDGKPRLFNDHIESSWRRDARGMVIWEVAIALYSDQYHSGLSQAERMAKRVTLTAGKSLALIVAYCDADADDGRQSFLTSYDIKPVNGDKNRAYIDANVFERAILVN